MPKTFPETKSYQYGDFSFKTYCKPAGQGYEVSLYCFGKPYFVGNFIHKKEALMWYRVFNKEINFFAKKYWCSNETPQEWYCHFLSNHLYKTYYSFLDKLFAHYNKSFARAYDKDVKKYLKLKKSWEPADRYQFKKSA